MNKKKIVGISKYEKNGKVSFILHLVSVDSVDSDRHVGQRVETLWLYENQMRPEITVGAIIRVYFDNYGGRASLSGIEVCKN